MAQPTATQALDQASKWLGMEAGVAVSDDGTISVEGTPPIAIALEVADDRLMISHVRHEEGAGATRADAVVSAIPDRGTLLDVAAAVSKAGVTFTYSNPVYLDGLSRHAVITALNELVATVDRLRGTDSIPTTVHQPVVAPEETIVEPANVFAQEAPAEDLADTAEAVAAPAGWAPTHRVPTGGMRAWDEPDPSLQPSSRLEARVELEIAERRGDWARAVGSNGWTGWVDARKLEEMGASSAPSASRIEIAGFSLAPLPLVGAVGLLLAAFLPWVDAFGGSSNSFDVALSFLWDLTASGAPYLGWAVVALAALALAAAAAAKTNSGLLRALGILAIALVVDFVIQMYRGVTDGGGSFGDVFDLLGFAPWIALGSGVVLLVAARRSAG